MKTITHASNSRPGVEYTTTIDDDGRCTCTCPGFVYRQKCRHVAEAKSTPVLPTVESCHQPMLARALPAKKALADFTNAGWVLEEKHDGHRLIVEVMHEGMSFLVKAYSRGGKTRDLPAHIIRALGYLPDGVYDGELLVPGGTSTDVKALHQADQLQLLLFDILESCRMALHNQQAHVRRSYLEQACRLLEPDSPVRVTPQFEVSAKKLQEIWDRGGEGAILKDITMLYLEGKRSPGWIKFKKLAAAELTITGFEEGRNGPHSTICLRDADGVDITVKTRNNCWLELFAANPASFIGRRLVISYQQKTADGKYRHPMADHFIDE